MLIYFAIDYDDDDGSKFTNKPPTMEISMQHKASPRSTILTACFASLSVFLKKGSKDTTLGQISKHLEVKERFVDCNYSKAELLDTVPE